MDPKKIELKQFKNSAIICSSLQGVDIIQDWRIRKIRIGIDCQFWLRNTNFFRVSTQILLQLIDTYYDDCMIESFLIIKQLNLINQMKYRRFYNYEIEPFVLSI